MKVFTREDGTLVVEIDTKLDEDVTFVFTRKSGEPLTLVGPYFPRTIGDGRTFRVRYGRDVPAIVITAVTDMALDACAEFDREPETERDPKGGVS